MTAGAGDGTQNVQTKKDLPILAFGSRKAWKVWLEAHHASSDGLWLKIAKKGSGVETVSYAQALETALCYGPTTARRPPSTTTAGCNGSTPRRPTSKWSKFNREKATRLIESGDMHPAGLREIEQAKADGRWDAAYDSQSKATVPEDLRRELERNEKARQFFATLDSANRHAILYRILEAKKPETRTRRIEKYVAMLAEEKKIHP